MRCHECGHDQGGGRYCGRCGAPVGAAAPASPRRPSTLDRRCDDCGHEQDGGRFCGRCGAVMPDATGPVNDHDTPQPADGADESPELATEAFGPTDPDDTVDDPPVPPGPQPSGWSPRRRWGVLTILAVVAVVALGLRLTDSAADPDPDVPDDTPASASFTGATDTVPVVDDGAEDRLTWRLVDANRSTVVPPGRVA